MEEPYTIVSLPRPLDVLNGKISAAPVFSLTGSRKRKRHEVVVGIDGESVNIYNVQTQHTIRSYPIPPRTYLSTNPTSIFCKDAQSGRSQRQTVIAVGEHRNAPGSRLLSFIEDRQRSSRTAQGFAIPVRKERALRSQSIIGIDILPAPATDNRYSAATVTFVSYSNGDIDCFKTDTLEAIWEYTNTEKEDEKTQYELAAFVDFETARKGLLRNREDIVASLMPESDGVQNSSVPLLLCQVFRTQRITKFRILSVRSPMQTSAQIKQSYVQELFVHTISHGLGAAVRHELHTASGLFYSLHKGQLEVFDLTQITPKKIFSSIRKDFADVIGFLRITRSSVLLLSKQQAALHEVQYNSVLSTSPFSPGPDFDKQEHQTSGNARSYKRTYTECITCFTDLGLVVILTGCELMALQMGKALADTRQAVSHDPLLIDLLGKRRLPLDIELDKGSEPIRSRKTQLWPWKNNVDKYIESDELELLEGLIAKDLRMPEQLHSEPRTDGTINGDKTGRGDEHDPSWSLDYHAYDPQYINDSKAMYMLGRVFQLAPPTNADTAEQAQLIIVVRSWNIIQWLAMGGYLSAKHLQFALSQPTAPTESKRTVAPGAVMNAIAHLNPDLSYVRKALALPVHWDTVEIIQGVRLLMRTLAPHTEQQAVGLPNTGVQINGIASNGSEHSQMEVDGRDEDQYARSRTSDQIAHLEEMQQVLSRLQIFPQNTLTAAMRSIMTTDEILFFVGVLRLMLAHAGWTSRYTDDVPAALSGGLPISIVSKLLSSAIDAIGAVGWIVGGSSNPEQTENVVACLRAEISAALEGCYEADTLVTLLQEVKHCAGSLSNVPKRDEEVTAEITAGSNMLPLGSSIMPPVVRDRRQWDGKNNQPSQAQAWHREVGQYEFEHFRV